MGSYPYNLNLKHYFMNTLNKRFFLLAGAMLLLTLGSCDKSEKYEREEREKIDSYLASHPDQDFELKPSGLYYLEINPGDGQALQTHDTACIKYTGKFLSGTVFDTNVFSNGTIDTLFAPVNEGYLVAGYDEGLTYMTEGGKSLMLIPSSLAYGPTGWGLIPGYTPLFFEVELLRVVPGPRN